MHPVVEAEERPDPLANIVVEDEWVERGFDVGEQREAEEEPPASHDGEAEPSPHAGRRRAGRIPRVASHESAA